MAAVKVWRVAWSAGAAIALGMIVNSSASAGVWSPSPQSPQMVGIYNGKSQYVTGQTLVVVEGQTLKLLGRSMDIDTLTEGSTTTPSLDVADVLWTASAGSVAPSRARSEDEVVVTPPDVPQGQPYTTFTVMAQADDNRTQDDPPGKLGAAHRQPQRRLRDHSDGDDQGHQGVPDRRCHFQHLQPPAGLDGILDWGTRHSHVRFPGRSHGGQRRLPAEPAQQLEWLVIREVMQLHPTDPGPARITTSKTGGRRRRSARGPASSSSA